MKPIRGRQHRAARELDKTRGVFSSGVGKLWPSDLFPFLVALLLFRDDTFCATKTELSSCDSVTP